jgi:C4-dicarboxylate-specific signal transduction histidine kinase
MFTWLRRRREDARRVEADAAALLAEYKHAAYSEARQRQQDAHNAVTFAHWGRVALAVARLTGSALVSIPRWPESTRGFNSAFAEGKGRLAKGNATRDTRIGNSLP